MFDFCLFFKTPSPFPLAFSIPSSFSLYLLIIFVPISKLTSFFSLAHSLMASESETNSVEEEEEEKYQQDQEAAIDAPAHHPSAPPDEVTITRL